ncbi:MAG: TonB-dependent receptor [Saprospiraceae bacterium]|nr:TonB-dependent receptor [Saprospiraceae bacterium]
MKKTAHFLFFLLLTSASLFGQITISGKITDQKSNELLIGAIVKIGEAGAVTDENGVFSIVMQKGGNYEATASIVGYDSQSKKITLTEGSNLTLDFALYEGNLLLSATTVTAGKFEKSLGEVTVSLDVISPKLIENINTKSVTDVLQKVPGVNIIDGQANIRGGSGWSYGAGSRVLLLVDDIPALQADAGFPNWRDVAVENIEQIEVVKGAASALYGSSAMNGIINIRTGFAKSDPETKFATFATAYLPPKDAVKHWWSAARGGGQPYEGGLSLSHKQKFGKFDFAGTVYYYNQSSYQKFNYNKYGRFSASTRYRITDRLSVGVNWNVNTGNSNDFFYFAGATDSAYIGAVGTYSNSKKTRFMIDPYLNYFDKHGNRHKILSRIYSVNNGVDNGQSNSSLLLYSEYQFQRKFENDLVLTAGLVGVGTKITAQLYGNQNYVSNNVATYAQLDKKIGKLNLSGGVRYERNTIFGPDSVAFNPKYKEATQQGGTIKEAKPVFRIGANYQLAQATFLRANWGQGYRFATVAEMFINTSAGALKIFPSPNLTSETGWSSEIGVKQGFKVSDFQGFVDVAGFWSEYQNMMEFLLSTELAQRTGVLGFQSQNVGNTRIKGIEASIAGQGRIGNWTPSVLIGYTYIDPKFRDYTQRDSLASTATYNVLKYRFRHNVKFDAEVTHLKFSVGFSINYNSHMEAVDRVLYFLKGVEAYRKAHDTGFKTVDLRAAYRFTPKIKLSLIGANILNEEYSYRPGLVEGPRNVQARVDWAF